MPIITLLSDWGLCDQYVASVKGRLYSYIPDAQIVDISHQIPNFNIGKAAHVLKNSYSFFPKGSIHIIGVNAVASLQTPHVLVIHDDHYFIGADNGIFSLLFDVPPENVLEIDIIQDSESYTFPCRDVFPKVAGMIAKGDDFSKFSYPSQIKNIFPKNIPYSSIEKVLQKDGREIEVGTIRGMVIYVDAYHNLITNISRNLFNEYAARFSKFEIAFQTYKIRKISKAYQDVEEGELVALFASDDSLQIAICIGKAASLLNVKLEETVYVNIKWTDPK